MRKTSGRGYQFAGKRPVRTLPTYKELHEGAERVRATGRKVRALRHRWDPEPLEAEDCDAI
jgi:hypothetical protein